MDRFDIMVVGAGIVGLATAYELLSQQPSLSIVVVDKETSVAAHQSGRNSGVLHTGVYYPPGSAKARHCLEGRALMAEFCAREGVPIERCGKVIVATREAELPTLDVLLRSAQVNGVDCSRISAEELKEVEPHAQGVGALRVPEASILDFGVVCERLSALVVAMGGDLALGTELQGVRSDGDGLVVQTSRGDRSVRALVNCAGLYSDHLMRRTGEKPEARVVPFRGEYYELRPEARSLCRGLIYPAPDPRFPFLGVHFTRLMDGGVKCGPNAVLAFSREGYRWRDIHPGELAETVSYPGFLRFAAKHWKTGVSEMWRSLSKKSFLRALQRLVPELCAADLLPSRAGVRAQALAADGSLVDDFVIQRVGTIVHVINAPSPAATASLSIGRVVAEQTLNTLQD